jgi:hypothetical protein
MSDHADRDAIASMVSEKSNFSSQSRSRFNAEYQVITLLAERDGLRQEVAALNAMITDMLRRK